MLTCPNCQQQQQSGKFCGVCGTAMEMEQSQPPVEQQPIPEEQNHTAAVENQAAATAEQPAIQDPIQQTRAQGYTQQKQYVNHGAQQGSSNFQKELSNYGTFLLTLLKNPSEAFRSTESDYAKGLINIALYILTFGLSIYFTVNTFYKAMMGMAGGMLGLISGDVSTPASVPLSFFSKPRLQDLYF